VSAGLGDRAVQTRGERGVARIDRAQNRRGEWRDRHRQAHRDQENARQYAGCVGRIGRDAQRQRKADPDDERSGCEQYARAEARHERSRQG
jgi:hypothetical protein